MENKQQETAGFRFSDLSLSCLTRQLLRNLWMIAAAALLFAACGLGYHRFVYAPRYQAEVTCAVTRGEGFDGAPEAAILLVNLLNAPASDEQLRSHTLQTDAAMSAGAVQNTNLILITLEGASPEAARQLAAGLETLLPEWAGYISGEIRTEILRSAPSSQPVNPQNGIKLCLICGMLGAVCMVFAICRRFALRQTVQTCSGARRMLPGAILALLPRSRSFLDEAYESELTDLCLQIERAHRLRGERLFLVAGAGTGEGKSTVAENLAKLLASRGRKVALAQWDPNQSSFTGWFQTASQSAQALEMLSEKSEGKALLKQLRKQFDYVILDTPPMLSHSHGEALAAQADAALLVVRQGHTPVRQIQEAAAVLKSCGCTFLGYVLNDMAGTRRMGDADLVPKLDIPALFMGCFRGLRRSWALFVLLTLAFAFLLSALIGAGNAPEYETSAVISVCDGEAGMNAVSVKMAAAFPQLLQTGLMEDFLKRHLGMVADRNAITASVVAGTNVVTVKVRSDSAGGATDMLNALLEGYPRIAAYTAENPRLLLRQVPSVPKAVNGGFSVAAAAGVGAVVGLLVAAAVVCVRAVFLHPLTDAQQLEEILKVPGVSVETKSGGESLCTLGLRVEKLCPKAKGNVVAVTATLCGEGIGNISAGLALTLADAGYKTVLVDGNLRHQSLYECFGGKSDSRGLQTCLEDPDASLDVCLKSVSGSRLVYLSGANPEEPVPDGEKLDGLLERLREKFAYVIVAAPPMGTDPEAQLLLQSADCVLYAARQDCATVFEIRETADRLRERGIAVHGCVFTCNGNQKT